MKKNTQVYLLKDKSSVITSLLLFSFAFFIFGFNAIANGFVILTLLLTFIWRAENDPKLDLSLLIFWALITYFILTVVGVLYSTDFALGLKFVERRLLILLFPVILLFNRIEFTQGRLLLRAVVYIVLVGVFIGFVNSIIDYSKTGDTGYFFNDNLVHAIDKQAPYYAFYINVCLVILLSVKDLFKRPLVKVILIVLFMISQFLLTVRLPLLLSMGLIFGYGLFLISKSSLRNGFVILMLIGTAFFISYHTLPQIKNRFISMTLNWEYDYNNQNPVNHFNGEIKKENWNGVNLRLALWNCGYELAKEQPIIGVGTGDYDKKFKEKLESVNFVYALKLNFGVHNQYLYTLITYGFIGTFIFLFSLAYLSYRAYIEKNHTYSIFIFVFAMSIITENILNRYYGIYFFSFINSLLFLHTRNKA